MRVFENPDSLPLFSFFLQDLKWLVSPKWADAIFDMQLPSFDMLESNVRGENF